MIIGIITKFIKYEKRLRKEGKNMFGLHINAWKKADIDGFREKDE
jgi:hypothetical protein